MEGGDHPRNQELGRKVIHLGPGKVIILPFLGKKFHQKEPLF